VTIIASDVTKMFGCKAPSSGGAGNDPGGRKGGRGAASERQDVKKRGRGSAAAGSIGGRGQRGGQHVFRPSQVNRIPPPMTSSLPTAAPSPETEVQVKRLDRVAAAAAADEALPVLASSALAPPPLPSVVVFDGGPPPELNSLKRLTKEATDVRQEMEKARLDGGLELAKVKVSTSSHVNQDFLRAACRKVDHPDDELLFTSLANLSVASSSSSSLGRSKGNRVLLAPPCGAQKKKKDEGLRLEDFFTPYQGSQVVYKPSKESLQDVLHEIDDAEKISAKRPQPRFKIQDEIDF